MAKPVQLIEVEVGKDGRVKYVLNEDAIEEHFLRGNLGKMRIAVISVAGKMRDGKSFILDFLLKYAIYRYKQGNLHDDKWMADEIMPVNGFTKKHTKSKVTNGIVVWPELFIGSDEGDRFGILLMDTEGTMDGARPASEWSTIFALSTMTSSLQMYNVMSSIGEQELQQLEFYTGYGKLATRGSSVGKIYDNLMFLVRDFKYGEEYGFGMEGGARFLQDQFENYTSWKLLSWNQTMYVEQHIKVRRNIESSFENLTCCVLPDPGQTVSEDAAFDGKLKHVEDRFKKEVKKFVPSLMAPDRIDFKYINGSATTVRELFSNLRNWVDKFNSSSDLPQPTSIYRTMAVNNHWVAFEDAMKCYVTKMETVGCAGKKHIGSSRLNSAHAEAKTKAVAYFYDRPKLGNKDITESFIVKLESDIDKRFNEYLNQNTARNERFQLMIPLLSMVGFVICVFIQYLLTCNIIPNEATEATWWVTMVVGAAFAFWMYDFSIRFARAWWRQSYMKTTLNYLVRFVKCIQYLLSWLRF